jgi:hypothetical protein
MKKFFGLMFLFLFLCVGLAFAQEAVVQPDIYDKVITFLSGYFSWFPTVLKWLGIAVVVGLILDRLIPDTYDGGFMSKLVNIPVLGHIILLVIKFSPLNYTPDTDLKK